MEYWQTIFLYFAIVGFIYQLFQFILFFNRNLSSKKYNAKDLLEKIYNQPSYLANSFKNLNF